LQVACAKAEAPPKGKGFALRDFKRSCWVKLPNEVEDGVQGLLPLPLHHQGLHIGAQHARWVYLLEQRGNVGFVFITEHRRS